MDYLNQLTSSLSDRFGTLLPTVLGAILVLIIGFFLARIVKKIVIKLLSKTKIDEKLNAKLKMTVRADQFIAKLFYYLVVIYTLIIALNILGVTSVLQPLEEMVSSFLGYVPNIIAAGIIAFAGYIISKLVSEATGVISERLERVGAKYGINSESFSLANLVKQVVFILIFIPILIVALDTLKMNAISDPATEMLRSLLSAVPKIIAAVIILVVFYVIGKYVVGILTELLRNLGIESIAEKMGLKKVIGDYSVSKIIGNIALYFILFAGLMAAADKLEMESIQIIFGKIFFISGKIFFGIIILMVGYYISGIAYKALNSGTYSNYLAPVARFAILGIFLAFGLHTMGIAQSIVNLTFGLTLGALAVAFALSFGLGGQKAAGKQMQAFFDNINNKKEL
ncbi:mechanosensitive ion channel [Portibacter lacus]|uniref:Uncharacterized protein n=1 Tax=Portibacter lacus TaxID=1099794 RepID=A0AA37WEY9_9BACT|nr:mechanosensitive ion channel [Portibacter lacus]GLR17967.1 hypothetical protein GCM10007940_25820 [Portibacter lacus]